MLTKCRIFSLRIETGRYEVMNRIKGIDANLRYCLVCNTERVEDEYHFLMVCPIYSNIRVKLLQCVINNIDVSSIMEEVEKIKIQTSAMEVMELFKYIMYSNDKDVIYELVKFPGVVVLYHLCFSTL